MSQVVEQKEFFKEYWVNEDNPHHANSEEGWVEKYAREILFHVGSGGKLLDCGCGNGDFLLHLAGAFEKVVALDYSLKMVERAGERLKRNNITNVALQQADVRDLERMPDTGFDVVFCNGLIQYLNLEEAFGFIKSARDKLTGNGKIVVMNIPDMKMQHLYIIEHFKNHGHTRDLPLILKLARARFYLFRKRLFQKNDMNILGIGFWYKYSDIEAIAKRLDMRSEIYYSMYPPYGYRFHAVLEAKS
ncbi:MAG: methyltransferase domain-containing protein [Flavobacteriales bacterium]|nr:methyltransferase domain-containing protein [Flavobacteriales bacterium]